MLEIVDETLTVDDIVVFAISFSLQRFSKVVAVQKSLTDSGVKYSGKVDNGSRLFVWDKNLSPLTTASEINY